MDRRMKQFLKVYPWYSGITGDLLFYIAIDTLFLTVVKNFSAAQIVSLTSVSTIACIALQFPLLWVIRKIGNTYSVRVGSLLMLASALLITFGPNYFFVVAGRLLHDMAVIFRSALFVALENNLEQIDRRQDFIPMRTKANTVYAVITMLISFVASMMFNLNPYLPMVCCIGVCALGVVLSFYIADYSTYNKITTQPSKTRVKLSYGKFILLTICVYGVFYALITCGQSDSKLFIQQHLLLDFELEQTSLIIGAILCISRIVRVLSNLVFHRLYLTYKEKVGISLPALLFASLALLILGSFVPVVIVKILIMSLGYIILLFIRDPFRLFIQDVLFESTAKEYHQTLLAVLEFSVKIARAAMSLAFTFVLLEHPMIVEMGIMAAIAAVEVFLSLKLYKLILAARRSRKDVELLT